MSASDHSASSAGAPVIETQDRLTDAGEVLFRQIHPNLYQDGKIASTAFMPTANDMGHLSVDRSSLTTAAAAFDLYLSNRRDSVAVYGVSVDQFEAQGVVCRSDPLAATDILKANPAHACADFTAIEIGKKRKQVAQRLRDRALERGRLHPQ